MLIETRDLRVVINDTPEMKEEVFRRVVAFFTAHDAWSGESVMQRDAPQIDAAPFLADIVDDVLKPKVTYE